MRSWVYAAPNRGFARRLANHASLATSALAAAPAGGPADVLLVETPPLLLAGAAVPYARAKRAKLVLNVADLWPDSAVEMGTLSSPRAIAAARALERGAYRAAAAIACPTEGIFASVGRAARVGGQGGADAPGGRPRSLRFRHRIPQRRTTAVSSALRVLYAGTVGLAHGLGTLLDAAEELEARRAGGRRLAVTIAGDGAEAPALRARLAARGPASVRMLGAVPAERIPSLYAESDVAVVHAARPADLRRRPADQAAGGDGRGPPGRARGPRRGGAPGRRPRAAAWSSRPRTRALWPRRWRRSPSTPRGAPRWAPPAARAAERDFGREAWLARWHELLAAA